MSSVATPGVALVPTSARLSSLDAFRGLVIVMMFFVNLSGDRDAFPAWFGHAGWNNGQHGQWLADFVFPWFLFIVGVAVPFSMAAGRGKGQTAAARIAGALRRGVTLYLLGVLIYVARTAYQTPVTWKTFVYWDILPLIGLGYVVAVCLSLAPSWVRWVFVAAVLIGKWVLLTRIDYPGTETVLWTQRENMQAWMRDRYGWLGTALTQGLPAAATVVLGTFAGDVMRREDWSADRRAAMVAAWGGVATIAALLWATVGGFPFSKDYFTSSYVLLSAGTAAVVLAGLYFAIDVRRRTDAGFLRVFGRNAIAVYVLAELVWPMALMRWQVAAPGSASSSMFASVTAHLKHFTTPWLGPWLMTALYIAFYWSIAAWLDRRRIYIRV